MTGNTFFVSSPVGRSWPTRFHRAIASAVWALALAALFPLTVKGTSHWTGGTGSWFEAENWSSGVPGSDENATIDLGGWSRIQMPGAVAHNVFIGHTSSGRLEIDRGGSLTNRRSLIGNFAEGEGAATISGSSSTWTSKELVLGNQGTGELTIDDHASVDTEQTTIGLAPGGDGLLTVDDAFWNAGEHVLIGLEGRGEVRLDSDADVHSGNVVIGQQSGAVGDLSLAGFGSRWESSGNLVVGESGEATLTIGGDTSFHVRHDTYLGRGTGHEGELVFDLGVLFTNSLLAPAYRLQGAGFVATHGLVTDIDLVFDKENSTQQVIPLDERPDQDMSIVLNVDGTGILGAGYVGEGSLTVADGRIVVSQQGILGHHAGAHGTAEVTGLGSIWLILNDLEVGRHGAAHLAVTDRGTLATGRSVIGAEPGSEGSVHVSDAIWTSEDQLTIGNLGVGELMIGPGGYVRSSGVTLGYDIEARGAATVSGSDAHWSVKGGIQVGLAGEGELAIESSAVVASESASIGGRIHPLIGESDSTGTVHVSGSGTRWDVSESIIVGTYGSGMLTIEDFAVVSSAAATIGQETDSVGTVLVDSGSDWSISGRLRVGGRGDGELTITQGTVSSASAAVGAQNGSTGIVTVDRWGRWAIENSLYVGGRLGGPRGAGSPGNAGSDGSVLVSTGSILTVGGATNLFPDGRVTLDGGQLVTGELVDRGGQFEWNAGSLRISGEQGLTIGEGEFFGKSLLLGQNQHLQVDHGLVIHPGAAFYTETGIAAGSVRIHSQGQMFVRGGREQNFGEGLVNSGNLVFTGETLASGPVTVANRAEITLLDDVTFRDQVVGNGSFHGPGMATFWGGLAPGPRPTEISFEGGVTLAGTNSLEIGIPNSTPGEFDHLSIAGAAHLGGTLEVFADPLADVEIGDVLSFINAQGGIFHEFNNISLPALAGGKMFELFYGETVVGLEVIATPPLAGDYNQDARVNVADYVVWRNHQDTDFELPNRNPALTGKIGQADYEFWVANFGSSEADGAAVANPASVPEPSSWYLLTGCFVGLVSQSLRRRN